MLKAKQREREREKRAKRSWKRLAKRYKPRKAEHATKKVKEREIESKLALVSVPTKTGPAYNQAELGQLIVQQETTTPTALTTTTTTTITTTNTCYSRPHTNSIERNNNNQERHKVKCQQGRRQQNGATRWTLHGATLK